MGAHGVRGVGVLGGRDHSTHPADGARLVGLVGGLVLEDRLRLEHLLITRALEHGRRRERSGSNAGTMVRGAKHRESSTGGESVGGTRCVGWDTLRRG